GFPADAADAPHLGEAAQPPDILLATAVLVEQFQVGLHRRTAGQLHLGVVAADHSALLQLLDTFTDRRARQVDLAGYLADRGARFGAQQADYLLVESVHGGSGNLRGQSDHLPGKNRSLTAASAAPGPYHGRLAHCCRAYPMSRLNQELGLIQGIALLSTSLLGTGIVVVPALAATAAGPVSLWAWLILIALILPMAFTFAQLGRAYPHAGGAPHLIGKAFGARMERLSALLFL